MQDRSRITINNILKAAQMLFTSRQYADVSLKDIAQESGVTKGALYHHFATKEDLYLKMMLHYLKDLRAQTTTSVEATRGQPCRARLLDSLIGFLNLPKETIAVIRLVRRDSDMFQQAVRQQLIDAYKTALPDLIQEIFSDAMAHGEIIQADARLLAWQFIAAVEVSLHPHVIESMGSAEALADFIVTNLVNGIAAPQPIAIA